LAARRAGSQEADAAISRKSSDVAAKVAGSVAFTPISRLSSTRVNPKAAARPTPMPAAVRRSPWPTTSWKIVDGPAPRAIRTPISAVRWRTTVANTP
jgi:hypothetical protein